MGLAEYAVALLNAGDTAPLRAKLLGEAFAEFERELIAERTMAGLAAARARGRMGGRPRKMDRATLMMAMAAMADHKAVAADVATRLGLTTTTLYVYVNGDGTPKAAGQALLDGTHRPGAAKARTRAPQGPPLARRATAGV
jgi:DNA invertase Pin-like site-specific DNA recombinase